MSKKIDIFSLFSFFFNKIKLFVKLKQKTKFFDLPNKYYKYQIVLNKF